MNKKKIVFISWLFLMFSNLFGQAKKENVLLVNALSTLSKRYNIQFNYDPKLIEGITVPPVASKITLAEVLSTLNTIPELEFEKINDHIIIVKYITTTNTSTSKVQQLTTVNLTGYLTKGIQKKTGGIIAINYPNFSILPGLIEKDVLHILQALPGIQSTDETVSNITIRGGSNDQNLILWDGIKMYQSGHFFGLISSFNPLITQETEVCKNGTDASYSDGVSGMIQMKTHDAITKNFKGSFGINFLNTNAFVDIPLRQKSSLQVAARTSISNILKTPTYTAYFNRITQNTEVEDNILNIINSNKRFDFYDTSVRWLYKPSYKDIIRVNLLTTSNTLEFKESAILDSTLIQRESNLSQQSYAGGINYKRRWNKKFTTHFNVYETDYILKAINANVLDEQRLLQKNSVSETGIRFMGDYLYTTNLKWLNGYQFIETGITNLNDVDIPRFRALTSEVLRTHSLFSQIEYTPKHVDIALKTGLRVNYLKKFEKIIPEPRLGLNAKIAPHVKLELLGEFKHQSTSQIINFQNDFLGIEKRRWQLANHDSIPITKSKQLSLGTIYTNRGWLIDLETYYKKVNGITTQSQGFSTKYEFEKTAGYYTAFGTDILIKKHVRLFNSWLSYSYITTNYTFNALEDKTFPSNFNITHTLSLGTTYTMQQLKLSGGIHLKTGTPTTLVSPSTPIINNTINFLSANNANLSSYFRADMSAIYNLQVFKKYILEAGVSIWNITNHNNVISNYFRNNDGTITSFQQRALGTTFNALINVKF